MLGGKGHLRVATKLSVFLAVAVLISMPVLAVNIGLQSDAVDDDNFITQDLGTEPLPEPLPIESQEIPEPIEPKGWVDKDFIISFDDGKGAEEFADALNVSVAVTPPGIEFEGTIHAVWDEYSDLTKSKEIHYSSSKDNGASWSGEEKDIIGYQ